MAKQEFKLPISAAKFPFDYAKASRAVLRPELDVVSRAPVSFAGSNESMDHNVIQLLHCENMMPVDTGMMSVGFVREAAGFGNTAGMKKLFVIRYDVLLADNGNRWYSPNFGWQALTGATLPARPTAVASLGDRAFVLAPDGSAVYEVSGAGVVTARSFNMTGTGVTALSIQSICASGNYLIALPNTYPTSPILWSSLTDPLNFADTASGAGRAIPNADIGGAHSVVGTRDGFIIFGYLGMIAATATGDATRPFVFKVIPDSSGTSSRDAVVQLPLTDALYILTAAGIQRVTHQRAETIFPDAYDFLRQTAHTVWDGDELVSVTKSVLCKVSYVCERYVVLSYGAGGTTYDTAVFTHALVYDLQLSRWGKVKLTHTAVIEHRNYSVELPYRIDRPTFVTMSGDMLSVQMDSSYAWGTAPGGSLLPDGIAVFGHIKSTRGKKITFHEAILDGVPAGSSVSLLQAIEGNARGAGLALSVAASDGARTTIWRGRYTGDNFDLAIEGQLDLTTIIASTQQHGSR